MHCQQMCKNFEGGPLPATLFSKLTKTSVVAKFGEGGGKKSPVPDPRYCKVRMDFVV